MKKGVSVSFLFIFIIILIVEFGSSQIDFTEHCGNLEGDSLKFCELFNEMENRNNLGNGYTNIHIEDDEAIGSVLGWGESRILGAYIDMYLATRDIDYLERFVFHADWVIDKMDNKRGIKDWKGVSAPGWSWKPRFGNPNELNYREVVHSGLIIYEIARFVSLTRTDASLSIHEDIINAGNQYLPEIEEVVKAHDNNWKRGPDENALENEGYYYWEDDAPVNIKGNPLPHNQQLGMGIALFVLYDLTNNQEYLDKAIRMGNIFKRALDNPEGELGGNCKSVSSKLKEFDSYCWPYWFGKRMMGGVAEDISHGTLDIRYAREANKYRILFTDRAMKKFANTFLYFVYRGSNNELSYRVDGTGFCRISGCVDGNDVFYTVGQWAILSEYNSEVYEKIKNIYLDENNDLSGIYNAVKLETYAKLTLHSYKMNKELFIRGDVNGDGKLDISDAIVLLSFLYQVSTEPGCLKSMDANDDGVVDLSDAVYLLNFIFSDGNVPEYPYPNLGIDPTPDSLTCNPK
jgi:hypothetical protein